MQIESYSLEWQKQIPELAADVLMFRHIQTGAEVLVVQNDDTDKAFCIGFRTPPQGNTGISHILEHSVLCGSQKYPSKEPFATLRKTSVNTYLNAWTFNEATLYPIASQNTQDFYNLMDVYLDAVFNPLLTPHVFMQEAWHYELAKPEDNLQYKGVVFNEMKGVYANPDSIQWKTMLASLFPDSQQGLDSGGDPVEITSLTHQDLVNYHAEYYHPSNARIYFYGNGNTVQHLHKLDEYLSKFTFKQVDASVDLQPSFASPKRVEASYPAGSEESGLYAVVGWVVNTRDPHHRMKWHILDSILTGSDATLLKKSLLESGLGKDLSGWGFSVLATQNNFAIGLKGVNAGYEQQVFDLVYAELAKAVLAIDPKLIEAAINSYEFDRRELTTDSARGIEVLEKAMDTWYFGGHPLDGLEFEQQIERIREEYAGDPKLFSKLIQDDLLHNNHRVELVLRPDSASITRSQQAEDQDLAKIKQGLSAEQLNAIIAQNTELVNWQATPDAPEVARLIPRLTIADLEKSVKRIPTQKLSLQNNVGVLLHDLPTRGISYIDLAFNMDWISKEEFPLLSLLTQLVPRLGTANKSYEQLSIEIDSVTGGIWPKALHAKGRQSNPVSYFVLSGKSFVRNQQKMVEIMQDILLNTNLDAPLRIKQLIEEGVSTMQSSIQSSAHRYATLAAQSSISSVHANKDLMSGISYYNFLKEMNQEFDNRWPNLLARLRALMSKIISSQVTINYTGTNKDWLGMRDYAQALLSNLPYNLPHNLPQAEHLTSPTPNMQQVQDQQHQQHQAQFFAIPSEVNYVALATKVASATPGSMLVAAQLLSTHMLWDKVRLVGGAYGSWCSFDNYHDLFSFSSYRDPNTQQTLDVFKSSADYLSSSSLVISDLQGAIISLIGEFDTPEDPGEKSWTALYRHLLNIDDAYRQEIRDQVMSTSLKQINQAGRLLAAPLQSASVSIIGNSTKLAPISGNGIIRLV